MHAQILPLNLHLDFLWNSNFISSRNSSVSRKKNRTNWTSVKRELSKLNYRIHTDAIKQNIA